MNSILASRAVPAILAAIGAGTLALWIAVPSQYASIEKRVPDMDVGTATTQAVKVVTDLKGNLVAGEGKPSDLPGAWPTFRGPKLDAISTEQVPLAREWKATGPAKLWSVTLGEGYAGAAILNGRVYVLDYDEAARADVLRCMSLADGKDIWRRSYNIDIGRNHGISRTVPAVTDKYVITLGPKCHVVCADAQTGDYKWSIDLVREYKTTVPPWYAGQCPLIDGDRLILAPGGSSLMIAVDCATGNVIWKAPNPRQWSMTHSSITPMTFNGKRMYLYCGSGGVAGISAETGQILWETTAWKVNMANVPTPVPIEQDRIFLSGGYGAGSMMLKLTENAGKIEPTILYRLPPSVFGAEQHTPIYYKGHLYGLIPPTGQLVCLSLEGKQLWNSGGKNRFGLGPFMIADGMIIVLHENGTLVLAEATETGFKPIAQAKVIDEANEAWGPLALAGGRLIARDMTRMVCLDLRKLANE